MKEFRYRVALGDGKKGMPDIWIELAAQIVQLREKFMDYPCRIAALLELSMRKAEDECELRFSVYESFALGIDPCRNDLRRDRSGRDQTCTIKHQFAHAVPHWINRVLIVWIKFECLASLFLVARCRQILLTLTAGVLR